MNTSKAFQIFIKALAMSIRESLYKKAHEITNHSDFLKHYWNNLDTSSPFIEKENLTQNIIRYFNLFELTHLLRLNKNIKMEAFFEIPSSLSQVWDNAVKTEKWEMQKDSFELFVFDFFEDVIVYEIDNVQKEIGAILEDVWKSDGNAKDLFEVWVTKAATVQLTDELFRELIEAKSERLILNTLLSPSAKNKFFEIGALPLKSTSKDKITLSDIQDSYLDTLTSMICDKSSHLFSTSNIKIIFGLESPTEQSIIEQLNTLTAKITKKLPSSLSNKFKIEMNILHTIAHRNSELIITKSNISFIERLKRSITNIEHIEHFIVVTSNDKKDFRLKTEQPLLFSNLTILADSRVNIDLNAVKASKLSILLFKNSTPPFQIFDEIHALDNGFFKLQNAPLLRSFICDSTDELTVQKDELNSNKDIMQQIRYNDIDSSVLSFSKTFSNNSKYRFCLKTESSIQIKPCHFIQNVKNLFITKEMEANNIKIIEQDVSLSDIKSFTQALSLIDNHPQVLDVDFVFANNNQAYVIEIDSIASHRESSFIHNDYVFLTTQNRIPSAPLVTNFTNQIPKGLDSTSPANDTFLKYIGFKNPDKEIFYKDSNFISYIYLYMYIPQIFSDFTTNDLISQKAPLAVAMNAYIPLSDQSDNPQRFLRRALALAKEGIHPLYKWKTEEIPSSSFWGIEIPARTFIQCDGSLSSVFHLDVHKYQYHAILGYMYSFCDHYTRPLALLYNVLWAKRSSNSARPNPILRPEIRNLACNFSLENFVENYNMLVRESQESSFLEGSLLSSLNTPSATASDVEKEIEYFVKNARVREWVEIQEIERVINKTLENKKELPLRMRGIDSTSFEKVFTLLKDEKNIDTEAFIDKSGSVINSSFAKELTHCLSILGKFWALLIKPMLTYYFPSSEFYKKFITGKDKSASVHMLDISHLFTFGIYSASLNKIKNDPLVTINPQGDKDRLSQADKVKNIMPYSAIKDCLKYFDQDPTYTFLGIDINQAREKRLSLGAFISIFSWIKTAHDLSEQDFVKGALQADYGVFKVFQPSQDLTNPNEKATEQEIRDRLEWMGARFSTCLGTGTVIEDALKGRVKLFVFMLQDNRTNLCTFGLMKSKEGYDLYDARGHNNRTPSDIGSRDALFAMIHWLESLIFTYSIPISDLKDYLKACLDANQILHSNLKSKNPIRVKNIYTEPIFAIHRQNFPKVENLCGIASKTRELLSSLQTYPLTLAQYSLLEQALINVDKDLKIDFFSMLFMDIDSIVDIHTKYQVTDFKPQVIFQPVLN